MSLEYKVTVTKIEKDVPYKDKEYKKVKAETDDTDAVYNYVYFDSFQNVETQVYNQTVQELDLQKLVQVVIEKI